MVCLGNEQRSFCHFWDCIQLNSNTLVTSCEESTHWKRPWCWDWLGAWGEGDDRGWDGWMASPTWWTWVGKFWALVMDKEAWHAVIHEVAKSQTWLSDWTKRNWTVRYGESSGTPLQYSCLENPRDGGAWWAAVYGVARVGHDWSNLAASAAATIR